MNSRLSLILAVLIFSLSSCENFNVIDNIAPPEHTPQLVVNMLLWPDENIGIEVTESVGILTYNPSFKRIENVDIKLYENGILLPTNYTWEGDYTYRLDQQPTPGSTYRLIVSAPGFETDAIGEFVLPSTPEIKSYEVKKLALDENEYQQEYELTLSLTDVNPEGDDYYGVSVLVGYPDQEDEGYINGVTLFSADPAFELIAQDEFFDEEGDGKKYLGNIGRFTELSMGDKTRELRFTFHGAFFPEPQGGFGEPLYALIIYHFSESQYKYAQTVQVQNFTQDNPFATPTQVHNNIQGGLGIAGGASYSGTYLEIE